MATFYDDNRDASSFDAVMGVLLLCVLVLFLMSIHHSDTVKKLEDDNKALMNALKLLPAA